MWTANARGDVCRRGVHVLPGAAEQGCVSLSSRPLLAWLTHSGSWRLLAIWAGGDVGFSG